MRRFFYSFLMLFVMATAQAAEQPIGISMMEVTDPVSGMAVKTLLWYPAATGGEPARMGPFQLEAVRDAPPAAGPFPLVVISHGNGGSHLSHRDTAQALAKAGYLVASLLHAGDNFQDQSLVGTERLLSSRPRSVTAVINALMQDETWPVDAARIGFFGFSAGGYTGLALLGAVPAYGQAELHCRQSPDDYACQYAPIDANSIDPITGLTDSRIKAAVIQDPLAFYFSDQSLTHVRAPVFLMQADQDDILTAPYHATRVSELAPGIEEVWKVDGSSHFSFLAPFPDGMAKHAGIVAQDPPGFDRKQAHVEINERVIAFFDRAL